MIKTSLILLLFAASCNSDSNEKKAITKKEIIDLYPEIFRVNFYRQNDRVSFSVDVNDLSKKNILYPLNREYKNYIDYLYYNYSAVDTDKLRKTMAFYPDTTAGIKFHISLLQQDSLFNYHFLELAGNYLGQKNRRIDDFALPAKKNYSSEELIDIATAFFYPSRYDSVSKTIDWYICVGKNPFHADSTKRKNPAVEAFCFMTLVDKSNRKRDYHTELKAYARDAGKGLMDIPATKDKLATAHSRMRDKMAKSTSLKKALQQMYKKSKEVLPFVVTDW